MDIPNPNTPLAFLSPEIGSQYQTACYVYVATFGVSDNRFDPPIDEFTNGNSLDIHVGLADVNER